MSEPDQIDMMNEHELRTELRRLLSGHSVELERTKAVAAVRLTQINDLNEKLAVAEGDRLIAHSKLQAIGEQILLSAKEQSAAAHAVAIWQISKILDGVWMPMPEAPTS